MTQDSQSMDFSNVPLDRIFTPIKPAYATPSEIMKPIAIPALSVVTFPVIVKSMTGKHTTITIHEQMTIEEIKVEIEKIDGIPIHQQRLVFNGKELQDTKIVESYNLKPNDMIHIVLRLRGGMFHETSSKKDHVYLNQNEPLDMVGPLDMVVPMAVPLYMVGNLKVQTPEDIASEIERLETMIRLKKYGLLYALNYALKTKNIASTASTASTSNTKPYSEVDSEHILWLKPKDYSPSP